MKKLFALVLLLCFLVPLFIACKSENITEETTTQAETSAEQTEKTQETTKKTEPLKNETIKISNEKHQFIFEKTDFEKNYSEDFLMKISKLIPMEYGYEDYENWDGTPNEILNDAFFSSSVWWVEGYEYKSDEWNAAVDEMEKTHHSCRLGEYSFTDLEKINSYLRSIYGPNARQFEKSDFEKFNDIINCEYVFENYDFNFRYVYLPETDLIVCFANEICFGGGEAIYVCDVKTVGDSYIVKAVTGSENLGQNVYTFEGIQGDALDMFNTYTYGKMTSYIFTIGCDDDGNLYMKSVEKSYILPDNAIMSYKVTSDDNAKVEIRKYYSSEWEVIDMLSNGEEFYSTGYYYDDNYVSIVTEKYYGRIEKKYVTEIE